MSINFTIYYFIRIDDVLSGNDQNTTSQQDEDKFKRSEESELGEESKSKRYYNVVVSLMLIIFGE